MKGQGARLITVSQYYFGTVVVNSLFVKQTYLIFYTMKKFLTFVFLAFFGVMAYAQDAEISFKSEEIDYGNIKQGADGVRVFEFTNTGKAPLVITNVASSCGCTV